MRALRSVLVIFVLVVGVGAALEFFYHYTGKRDTKNAASDVASFAGQTLLADANPPAGSANPKLTGNALSADVQAKATARARGDHVTLTAFFIDSSEKVHVSVAKQGREIIVGRFSNWRGWDQFSASATGAP